MAIDREDDDGPWGIYATACATCGATILHVCTVHSVTHGYVEWAREDVQQCQTCRDMHLIHVN